MGWGSLYGVGVPVCDPKLFVPWISFIPWLPGHRVWGFVPFKGFCPEPVFISGPFSIPNKASGGPGAVLT